jgi:sugar-specific transcriptional regulator TrmB
MTIESALQNIGLSKQEAAVYLSALKLGLAKVSEIAQKANIKREAAYYVLKSLQEKGFVSETIKSGVKYYGAIQPKRILEILGEEKQRKVESVKEVLPELESLQKISLERPKIEVYEGIEGFKTAISKLIEKENQEIYCYVPERILHFLPTFHPQFRRKRRERNVRFKMITEKTKFMEEIKKADKEEIRETRFNNHIMKNVNTAFYILPDAVLILKANEKEQLGVYIKEEGNAQLQRQIFHRIWTESLK